MELIADEFLASLNQYAICLNKLASQGVFSDDGIVLNRWTRKYDDWRIDLERRIVTLGPTLATLAIGCGVDLTPILRIVDEVNYGPTPDSSIAAARIAANEIRLRFRAAERELEAAQTVEAVEQVPVPQTVEIPEEFRTGIKNFKERAVKVFKHLELGQRQAIRKLKDAIEHGEVKAVKLSGQRWYFDKRDFELTDTTDI